MIEDYKIIGRAEWCSLFGLNIPAILARIDSGAKTSSLQATDIVLIKQDNEDWVRFVVNPLQKNTELKIKCKAKVIGKRSVKGSFGISEDRFIIRTPITIADDTFDIEFSLANRNSMAFRMLLGREAMMGNYLINPGKKHIQKKYTKRQVQKLYNL